MQRFISSNVKWRVLVGLACLACGPSWAPAADTATPAASKGEFAFRCGAYLQDPTADAVTVMWMTSGPSYSWVEYGLTDKLGSKADTHLDGLRQANNHLHRVRLTGLKAKTSYRYRICSKQILTFAPYKVTYGRTVQSPVHTFTTADPAADRVRVAVFNDIHGNLPLWAKLYAQVAERNIDFAVLNGDILSHIENENQLAGGILDFCSKTFATQVPYFYARGNHETRGSFARQIKRYFSLPGERYYYAFTRGPVRFVILDSGEDKEDSNGAYSGLADFDRYRDVQRQWLAKEITSDAFSKAKYRIVIHHIPPYHSGDWHGTTDVRKKWGPLYNTGKIDLYIGGHTHRYGLYKPDPAAGHNYPIAIGGSPKAGRATVIYVDADAKSLSVQMIRDDGKIVHEYRK